MVLKSMKSYPPCSGVQIQIRIWFESDLNPIYV